MKFQDLITKEEAMVMYAVASGQLHTIENGDVNRINKLLKDSRDMRNK